MKTLQTKLRRDLWRLRFQCLSIAGVVACGVGSFVATMSAAASVAASRDAFYADARFADVFVHLKGAPRPVLDRLRELPGVAAVDGRLVGDYRLLIDGSDEPVVAHFVSVAWPETSRLDRTRIQSGRRVEPGSADEVVLSEVFADTWGLVPGSSLVAVVNGRRATLKVVGTAISPEFVWASSHTGLPDPWHYGVAWMDEGALSKALGLAGGFNDAVLQLAVGADEPETLRRVDALLEPYGGLGSVGRSDQQSAKLLDQKVDQLKRVARTMPAIFLLVAAFLLHVLLSRIVGTQREQIATLKALGYRTRELAVHYLEIAGAISAVGCALGLALATATAHALLAMYAVYFRFPAYLLRVDPWTVVGASLVAIGAGIVGTYAAVRKAVSIPPAEAMRPEAPATYRPSVLDRAYAWLPPVARMVARNVLRHPARLALSAMSIALSTSVVLAGGVMADSLDDVVRLQFEVSEREDITVVLDAPHARRAVRQAAHMPGVTHAEGERQVPVRLHAGHRARTAAILGLDADATLHRLLDAHRNPLRLPASGLSLSRVLGEELGVVPGDVIDIDVLESDRRKVRVPVTSLVDDLLGFTAYMSATELAALMGESLSVNLLLLSVDARDVDAVIQRLAELPAVAGVTRPSVDRSLLRAEEGDIFVVVQIVLALFASVIAIGVVYNNARIALETQSRDLATLRILGFTRAELSFVLLGEQAIQVGLGIPPGLYLGRVLGGLSLAGIDRELLRIPVSVAPASYVGAACVVLLAALASALLVRRKADHLDLVAVLKARD